MSTLQKLTVAIMGATLLVLSLAVLMLADVMTR